MSVAAKTPRIKIQVVDGKSRRLFLVTKETARVLSRFLESAENEESSIPAEVLFPELNDSSKTPGIALRGVRLRLGLNQKTMAEKIGVTQGDLSKMERGERPIGKKLAMRIGKALKQDYRRFL